MPPRNQRLAWRSSLTDSWWWRRQCSAISEGRPRVDWGVSTGTKGRRAVYAHKVEWTWLCWTTRAAGARRVRVVAGWKCRGVSRDATLCRERPPGLRPCPKCLTAEVLAATGPAGLSLYLQDHPQVKGAS